jgi:hypothetical protein
MISRIILGIFETKYFKKIIEILFFASLLSCNALSQVTDTTDYFPLHVGDKWWRWNYLGPFVFKISLNIVDDSTTINDTLYYSINNTLYRKDSIGNVYRRNNNLDQLFFKVTASVGEIWTINSQGNNYKMKLYSQGVEYITFLGLQLKYKLFTFFLDSESTDKYICYTLANGIGEIAYNTDPISNEYHELRRAIINGKIICPTFGFFNQYYTQYPKNDQKDVNVNTKIKFCLRSTTEKDSVFKYFKLYSTKVGDIKGILSFDSTTQNYIFSLEDILLPDDTISIKINGELKDIWGDGFDGNCNWKYEGSPDDDYEWTFYTNKINSIEEKNEVINFFMIYQNYPNPFNPTTTINYTIKGNSIVTLKVYDVLGREVSTLINGNKESGSYSVSFDGKNLSSGIYFYRLEAIPNNGGNKVTIQKSMMLMK